MDEVLLKYPRHWISISSFPFPTIYTSSSQSFLTRSCCQVFENCLRSRLYFLQVLSLDPLSIASTLMLRGKTMRNSLLEYYLYSLLSARTRHKSLHISINHAFETDAKRAQSSRALKARYSPFTCKPRTTRSMRLCSSSIYAGSDTSPASTPPLRR
jgi:hypothetical protein